MKKTFLTLILAFATLCADAQAVWEHPAAEKNCLIEGVFGTLAEITRVEFAKDETRVYMHLAHRPDSWLRFAQGTYLQADGKRYTVRSCDGLELGKETFLTDNGKADVVFHFEPLPLNTTKFDLKEGDSEGDFCIFGVQERESIAKELFPSAWRNCKSGDWEIAFYDECAIYDCRFWNYKERRQNGDKYELLLESDGEELNVKVGKSKKGRRRITIGESRNEYEIISTITLPDYARKDTVRGLKDNRYQQVDTVTLIGWLRGAPKHKIEKANGLYEISIENILTDEQEDFLATMDSLGRFTIKIPLLNTSEVFMDWNITYLRSIFEPGETYFLLYDQEKGHKLFMGSNARLQNEILSYPIPWCGFYVDDEVRKNITASEVMEKYLPKLKETEARFARLLEEHPSLSERYIQVVSGNYRCQYAASMMQARFSIKNRKLTKEYMDFVHGLQESFPAPAYTFCRDYSTLLRDITDQLKDEKYSYRVADMITISLYNILYPCILERYRKAGKVEITDEELAVIGKWVEANHILNRELENESDIEERNRRVEELEKQESSIRARSIIEREDIMAAIRAESPMMPLYATMDIAESQGYDRVLKEILIVRSLHKTLEQDNKPLSPLALQYIEENVTLEPLKASIISENDKYIAIQNSEMRHAASLRSNDDVAGIAEGEEILRKLLEPMKGKVVIIDVWGTWCGPCKAALAHSQEEYERLNKYNVAYLYLANSSPEESWKNVIKEYGVTGENVYHYNLPEEQQTKVERFLKVTGFPTYRIVDGEGNILDINADAHDLDGLEKLVELISK